MSDLYPNGPKQPQTENEVRLAQRQLVLLQKNKKLEKELAALRKRCEEAKEVIRRGHYPHPKIARVVAISRKGRSSWVLEINAVRQISPDAIEVEVLGDE